MSARKGLVPGLAEALEETLAACKDCRLCQKDCAFLEKYGTPGEIARAYDPDDPKWLEAPFECSLCGLCGAVCRRDADPAGLFLLMRRESARREAVDYKIYGPLLSYEARGASKRFTLHALPAGCDTVLFPGCNLPGSRPAILKDLFGHLQTIFPNLGLVLDCCGKPSHDLGREAYFHALFGEVRDRLAEHGIQRVILACPNCHKVFSTYGNGLKTPTVWEVLAEHGLPEAPAVEKKAVLHDPCPLRKEDGIQEAVRTLLARRGISLKEPAHSRGKTICCGEGGAVFAVNREFALRWAGMRRDEAGENRVVTYCAGCAGFLDRKTATSHVLDALFEPQKTFAGKMRPARSPVTYLNRIRLKSWVRKTLPNAELTERDFSFKGNPAG